MSLYVSPVIVRWPLQVHNSERISNNNKWMDGCFLRVHALDLLQLIQGSWEDFLRMFHRWLLWKDSIHIHVARLSTLTIITIFINAVFFSFFCSGVPRFRGSRGQEELISSWGNVCIRHLNILFLLSDWILNSKLAWKWVLEALRPSRWTADVGFGPIVSSCPFEMHPFK